MCAGGILLHTQRKERLQLSREPRSLSERERHGHQLHSLLQLPSEVGLGVGIIKNILASLINHVWCRSINVINGPKWATRKCLQGTVLALS